ncbi:sugar ABC transporter substrate-binding protein [Streptomyces sp. NPDC091280]|uniref:sugar ABC transporter substrate-binding protein n=1 Tax=Streptomyces sp. NPDC091280 TaxID=3365984 RepID=UPI0038018AE9
MHFARPLRPAAIAALSAGALVALSACGGTTAPAADTAASKSGGASSGNKTIIFSPGTTKVSTLKALADGVKAYGQAHGYKVIVQDADNNPQTQVTQLTSAIGNGQAGGVYALMLDSKSAGPVIQAARKAGVPVFATGLPADYGLSGLVPGVSLDYTDSAAVGKAAGTELGTCINEKLGGKAQVILGVAAPGIPGASVTEAAERKAIAATAPGAKIVTSVQITVDQAKAQTDFASALQGHPSANAVLANIDTGALGALGAYASAGKSLPCAVAAGGSPEGEQAVKSGKLYALVALDFQRDMAQAMDALMGMMKNPKAMGKQFTVPQKTTKADK